MSGHSSHRWLAIFAGRLMELRPTASIASAVRCAVANIHDASDLDPRLAADCFAVTPARARTRQTTFPKEPQSARYQAMFGGSANDPSGSYLRSPRNSTSEAKK